MPDPTGTRTLVNLRPHVVEVHLAERAITIAPLASVEITDSSPQVDELVRRGLVEIRSETTPTGRPPAKKTSRAGRSASVAREGN